jgi:hypothetical protein
MIRILFALFISFSLGSAALAVEPVFPPGSRIGLVPPPGMTPGTSFQGFEDRAQRVALLLSAVSAQTYTKIAQEFTPETIRNAGMEEVSRETLRLASGDALLVVTRTGEKENALRKWALLTRTDDLTVTVIGVVPETAREAYPDAVMHAAFASLVVRARLTPDEMLAVLPYRLGDLGGFHLLRTGPDGTAVMTLGPMDTSLPAQQPYFMIAPRPGETPEPAERDRFAQRLLAGFLNRPTARIINSEPLRIGGATGHQIVALTVDEKTGDELAMVQWLRFGPGVVQMFGMARRDQWEDAFSRMRAVRDGFGPK